VTVLSLFIESLLGQATIRTSAANATPEELANCEVEAWREVRATDAEVLATAGIGALEAQLLAADG
jgi:hypothetical protein